MVAFFLSNENGKLKM